MVVQWTRIIIVWFPFPFNDDDLGHWMDELMVVWGVFDSFTWWVIYLILFRIGGFAVVRGELRDLVQDPRGKQRLNTAVIKRQLRSGEGAVES